MVVGILIMSKEVIRLLCGAFLRPLWLHLKWHNFAHWQCINNLALIRLIKGKEEFVGSSFALSSMVYYSSSMLSTYVERLSIH